MPDRMQSNCALLLAKLLLKLCQKKDQERERKEEKSCRGSCRIGHTLFLSLFQLEASVQILVQLAQLLAIDFGVFVLFSLVFFSLSLSLSLVFRLLAFFTTRTMHIEKKSAKFHDLRQIASILSSKWGEDMPTVHVLWYLLHDIYMQGRAHTVCTR